MLLALRQVRRF